MLLSGASDVMKQGGSGAELIEYVFSPLSVVHQSATQ